MESERVVFWEQGRESELRVFASGEIEGSLLDGLQGYLDRQRRRLRNTDYTEAMTPWFDPCHPINQ